MDEVHERGGKVQPVLIYIRFNDLYPRILSCSVNSVHPYFSGVACLPHILQSIRWPPRAYNFPHTYRVPLLVLHHQGCLQRGVFTHHLLCHLLVLDPLA